MTSVDSIREQWQEMRAGAKPPRIRDAADQLGVSEEALLTTDCGDNVKRLKADWKTFIPRLGELGRVMALTRNDDVVHEVRGEYKNIHLNTDHGLVLGGEIDLRLFPSAWHSLYTERRSTARGELISFQIFDEHGKAIHKVYIGAESNREAFEQLEKDLMSDDQSAVNPTPPEVKRADDNNDVDVELFRQDWAALQDTHEFFGMLKRHGLPRTQALRIAGPDWARRVPLNSFTEVITAAAETQTPIMAFVGNGGILQIFSGTVNKTAEFNGWFNVMDPGFNLHINGADLHETWYVRKPSRDGMIHSLEIFNDKGEMVLQLFGKRKPGIPELNEWREVLASKYGAWEEYVHV